MKSRYPQYSNSVFINCPFDDDYKSLFHVMVFAIQACGFTPRCAKEDNGTDNIRIQKIIEIMRGCQLGIHDLSRRKVVLLVYPDLICLLSLACLWVLKTLAIRSRNPSGT